MPVHSFSLPPNPVKIQQGNYVLLEYNLLNNEGTSVESSAEDGGPMGYVHGMGELPEALEQALEGQGPGFEISITLPEGEAYGPYDPEQLISVPRDQFPPDAEIVKGDWIELHIEPEDENGNPIEGAEEETMEARVVQVSPEAISLDTNHPLAGQEVTFNMKVVSVEESSPESSEVAED